MGGTQFLQSESAPGRTYDPVLVQMLYHRATGHSGNIRLLNYIQLNLSTTVTLGTEKRGHCREVAVVERLKQACMDFSFLVLYILADLISFLEIQRLQLAGSSSTVFAVNLILL